jgi:hypothetical protein
LAYAVDEKEVFGCGAPNDPFKEREAQATELAKKCFVTPGQEMTLQFEKLLKAAIVARAQCDDGVNWFQSLSNELYRVAWKLGDWQVVAIAQRLQYEDGPEAFERDIDLLAKNSVRKTTELQVLQEDVQIQKHQVNLRTPASLRRLCLALDALGDYYYLRNNVPMADRTFSEANDLVDLAPAELRSDVGTMSPFCGKQQSR